MLAKARGAGGEARLVPVPPVRERGQRRHALAHHRAGDPRGLRGRAARLLGDRRRHRRHAEGRRARAEGASGRRRGIALCEPDNSPMLGSGIAQARQADGSAGGEPSDVPPAPDAGLGARLHPEADARTRSTPAMSTGSCRQRRRRAAAVARARAGGGHLLRHLRRRHASPAPCGLPRSDARGQRRALHAARHRRALSLHAALRRHPGGR